MPRRLLALVVAAGLLGTGCADDVAPAARVGDRTITSEELLEEVAEWAGNDQTQRAADLGATAAPTGYPIGPVLSILQERILLELTAPVFDEMGLELTDELRDQSLQVILGDPTQAEVAFAGFSSEYADSYVDDFAEAIAVQTELGEEAFLALVQDASADIEINPRYGTWDAALISIVPPVGPRPAPARVLSVP